MLCTKRCSREHELELPKDMLIKEKGFGIMANNCKDAGVNKFQIYSEKKFISGERATGIPRHNINTSNKTTSYIISKSRKYLLKSFTHESS